MRFYNRTFPLCFGAAATAIIAFAPKAIALSELVAALVSATALLPGFYIAALAAVSTFAGPHMDEAMPEPTPELDIQTLQTSGPEKLTRRMFLCYLFGYLAVISLLLVFAGTAVQVFIPSANSLVVSLIPAAHVDLAIQVLSGLVVFFLTATLGSIFITSLQGIYYLMERIFQPN